MWGGNGAARRGSDCTPARFNDRAPRPTRCPHPGRPGNRGDGEQLPLLHPGRGRRNVRPPRAVPVLDQRRERVRSCVPGHAGRPDVVGGRDRDGPERVVASSGRRHSDRLPRGAVPLLRERLVVLPRYVVPDGPDRAPRSSRDRSEHVVPASGVSGCNDSPPGPVPVLGQRPVSEPGRLVSDGPHIRRR